MAAMSDRIWLLLGPEHGQKQDFLNDLQKKLTKQFNEAPEVHKFYAFETPFGPVLSLLQNGDLFAAHKLVLIHNVDEYKKPDNDLIKGYVKHPASESTLVLFSDETRVDSLIRVIPKEQVKVFWEMFESQKKGWVLHHFKELGLGMSSDAAEFFLEMVDNSTDQIRLEAQKLLAFFEAGANLSLEDLEQYLVHTKEENVFTLFEKITSGEFSKALEVLKKILGSKESEGIGLLGGLTWQFKNLLAFQAKLAERRPVEEAFTELRITSKKAQANFQIGARRYSLTDLQAILVLTADFDQRLRQFRTEHHSLILELYLYYVIVKKGRATEAPDFGWPQSSPLFS
jgi:DNA polymerase-3 subunit delta